MILEPDCGDEMFRTKKSLPQNETPAQRNLSLAILVLALVMLGIGTRPARADEPKPPHSAAGVESDSKELTTTQADTEPTKRDSESSRKIVAPAPSLAPEKFRDVDDAAKLLIWLVVSCGLGMLVLLCVIVLGAKRMRRLTQSKSLKSKYDELEFLRLKHRREVDGLPSPKEPKTEIR